MKVAVTSTGPEKTCSVDQRLGRAKWFLVADTKTGEFAAHENSANADAAQGAGVQAGQTIVKLGVDAVITGHVGPRAFATLQAGNVKVYVGASGTVEDALGEFKAGRLKCAGAPNAEAHWT